MQPFHPDLYREFRPTYPTGIFDSLIRALPRSSLWKIVDLGCGTGFSSVSFLRAAAEKSIPEQRIALTLVDSNQSMLNAAEKEVSAEFILSSAESTPLLGQSVDGILIGSAVHWMDRNRLLAECRRILKPSAPLLIFEYQFPSFKAHPELNQWIKTQFNTRWKAPGQKPRGSFDELLEPFQESAAFEVKAQPPVPMLLPMSLPQLAGFIFSQSRYQHHELTLSADQQQQERQMTVDQLTRIVGSNASELELLGDFRLDFRTFILKNPIEQRRTS